MFNLKTKNAAALSVDAGKILSVFQNTITGLTRVIKEAEEGAQVKEAEIQEALSEKKALEEVAAQNKVIVERIEAILK